MSPTPFIAFRLPLFTMFVQNYTKLFKYKHFCTKKDKFFSKLHIYGLATDFNHSTILCTLMPAAPFTTTIYEAWGRCPTSIAMLSQPTAATASATFTPPIL